MPFTNEQLATAIEEVSERFFVVNDDDLISNRVLKRLFENLTKDIRGERPLGTTFSALAKLARDFYTVTSSMGHIPERLAKRLCENRVRTAINGVVVEFEFFGPDAKHRRSSGTAANDKRLYLEFHHEAQTPSIPADDPVLEAARAEQAEATRASSQLLSQVIELQSKISEQASQTQPPRSPRELPQPPRDFAGREEELREILDAIWAEKFTIVGLQGPGGIGKTALGLALAERLSPDYDSSVFLDLEGNTKQPLTPSDVIRHVLRAYNPGRALPDSLEDLSGLYHSLLHEKPALLFFDNARDAAQLQPLMPPATSFLLVTSIPRFTFPGMCQKRLDPLEPEAARAMLVAIEQRCTAEAEVIATLCGRFPLALRAAGHALAEMPGISPEAYAERLRDTRRRLELVDPTTDRSVEAVLNLSYALLPSLLQEHFDSLAVFPATFDCAAVGAVWRLPPDAALDALATLVKFSFVEYDEADGRYHLHNLLRAFADSHVTPSLRHAIERRFARHFRSVLHAEPWSVPNTTQSLAAHRLLLEWPNVTAAHDWAKANAATGKLGARLLITLPSTNVNTLPMSRADTVLWIAAGTGLSRSRRQRSFAGLNLTRQAIQHAYSGEFALALRTLARLSDYIEKLGDLPTTMFVVLTLQLLASEVPALRTTILTFLLPYAASTRETFDQVQLLVAVARIYGNLDQYDEAFSYYDRAMLMSSAIGHAYNALPALLTWTCDAAVRCHKLDRASQYVDQLLAISDTDDSRLTTILFGILASSYATSGDFERAEQLYRLYITRSRHPGFLAKGPRLLANEAKIWYTLAYGGIYHGKRATICEDHAIELLTEAQRVARERFDTVNEEHASVSLGLIYAIRKDFTKAKRLLPRALYQKVVRGDRATVALALMQTFGDYRG